MSKYLVLVDNRARTQSHKHLCMGGKANYGAKLFPKSNGKPEQLGSVRDLYGIAREAGAVIVEEVQLEAAPFSDSYVEPDSACYVTQPQSRAATDKLRMAVVAIPIVLRDTSLQPRRSGYWYKPKPLSVPVLLMSLRPPRAVMTFASSPALRIHPNVPRFVRSFRLLSHARKHDKFHRVCTYSTPQWASRARCGLLGPLISQTCVCTMTGHSH